MAGLRAQNISRSTLPYAAPFQPYSSYIAIFITFLVLFFKGFAAFMPTFDYKSFITNYIGVPIYIVMWIVWKLIKKTSFLRADQIDFSGARQFDVLDEEEEEKEVPMWKKKLMALRPKKS
jgi:amino acid transporter